MEISVVYIGLSIYILQFLRRASHQLKEFLQKYDTIADEYVLQELKVLVRRQGKNNLLHVIFLVISAILSHMILKGYGIWGCIIVYPPIALIIWKGLKAGKLEKQIKTLPAATEELSQQHRQICMAWNRLLPNF